MDYQKTISGKLFYLISIKSYTRVPGQKLEIKILGIGWCISKAVGLNLDIFLCNGGSCCTYRFKERYNLDNFVENKI